jgi:hypothetical protein
MENVILYFLVWLTVMCLFIVALPEDKSKRVMQFIKMVLHLLPVTTIIQALKNDGKKDKKSA